jgi:hypothetical protein
MMIVKFSHAPRATVLRAAFDGVGFSVARVRKTDLRSVTLGWVYLIWLWPHTDYNRLVYAMSALPVEFMGPWEAID